jgi:hypothetical protein
MVELVVRPIGPWTGKRTASPEHARFRAGLTDTKKLLRREAQHLGAKRVVVLLDVTERDIKQDGDVRADARLRDNGVAVAMDTKWGPLRYSSDRYWDWRDNLRAIALSLEALRAVDRYGVSTRGEQYTGWAALPAGSSGGFTSADEAGRWLMAEAYPEGWDGGDLVDVLESEGALDTAYRNAARRLHPDVGGDPEDFKRLNAARDLIDAARKASGL